MNAAEYLDLLNAADENERLEAKRGSEIGTSILETDCAFANEPGLQGGTILLGIVRDESDLFSAYTVEGVEQPDKISADLATQCREQFNVPVRVQISSGRIGDKNVLIVAVPEAQPSEKPIHLKKQGLPRGAFRRIGSTDQRCTEDDLAVLYSGRNAESFDYTVCPEAEFTDLDPDAIDDYRQSRREVSADAQELTYSDTDLMLALGCARWDGAELKPTVAGILLFGTAIAIRRFFPMMRVDYIRIVGKEWAADPAQRFDSVDMRGPLMRLLRRAQATVLDDLPKSFSLPEGAIQRTDIPLIPVQVIREALVNALMHRSYRVHSPIQIIRYSNRLEIRNPGYSLVADDRLGEPGSVTRNPKIASVLHETRFAETKGTGIRVMRRMMEEAGLTPPLFESDRGRDLFTATYLFHHFLGPEDIAWLAQFRGLNLSDDEARALVFVREVGAIDNAAYRNMNRVDTLQASAHLRRLRDARLLEQRGRGSATYYLPTAALHAASGGEVAGTPPDDQPGPQAPGLPSQALDHMSQASRHMSQAPDHMSQAPDHMSQAGPGFWDGVPEDLRQDLQALGQRLEPERTRHLILRLCRLRPWRAEELAQHLGRDAAYLVRHHLSPLVQAGRLVQTIPEMPRHPEQAYRTVGTDETAP